MELSHASGVNLVELVGESQASMWISVSHSCVEDPLHGVLATIGPEVVDVQPIHWARPVASVSVHVIELVPDMIHKMQRHKMTVMRHQTNPPNLEGRASMKHDWCELMKSGVELDLDRDFDDELPAFLRDLDVADSHLQVAKFTGSALNSPGQIFVKTIDVGVLPRQPVFVVELQGHRVKGPEGRLRKEDSVSTVKHDDFISKALQNFRHFPSTVTGDVGSEIGDRGQVVQHHPVHRHPGQHLIARDGVIDQILHFMEVPCVVLMPFMFEIGGRIMTVNPDSFDKQLLFVSKPPSHHVTALRIRLRIGHNEDVVHHNP